MSEIKKLAGQTAIYGIPTIVGRILNYFLVPIYTYNLVTSDYGVVNTLYAYASFMMILLTYGMETAYFRYCQEKGRQGGSSLNPNIVYNTALLSLMTTTFAFLAITFAMLGRITGLMNAGFSNNAFEAKYIAMFLVILALDALRAIPYARLRMEQKAKRFALIKSADIFTNIALNLFFILIIKPLDLISAIFASNLIASAVSFILLTPQFAQFRFRFSFSLWRKMFLYGLPVMIGGLAGMINETFDRIALQHLLKVPLGVKDGTKYILDNIGIYGACYKISIIMTLFIQAFKFAAEPFFFSKMKSEDAKQTYSRVMSVYTIFLCFIFLSVMAYMDLFQYFVGAEYRVGLTIVPILLVANLFLGVYYNLAVWYKVSDKTIYGAYISIFGALITLILNYVLVPHYGYMGSAWTTLACYFAIMVACYLLGRRHYHISYPIKRLTLYFCAAIGLYFLMRVLPIENTILRLAANTTLLLAFAAAAYKLDISKLIKQ
ncbi:MAG: oligosaccharide flippase family protein [Bacteroidales bacterium]|jgi:O-antigen/teichoic acid export membrane protein|nr:oligosaccharide flippase family protein [Bacteroidales bacterium]